jgi:hypothetical protein
MFRRLSMPSNRFRVAWALAIGLVQSSPSWPQETTLFFEQADVLFRVSSTGTDLQQLTPLSINAPVRAISSHAPTRSVYWIESGAFVHSVIWRLPASGGEPLPIVISHAPDDLYLGIDVEATSGRVFWSTSRNGGTIVSSNLDGSGISEVVLAAGPSIYAVQARPPYVYWTTDGPMPNDGSIRRAPSAGGAFAVLASALAEPRDLVVDTAAAKVYWTESSAGRIRRANLLDGSNPETVAQGLSTPFGLALDIRSASLYWTEAGAVIDTGVIRRRNVSTGDVQTIIDSLSAPGDIHAVPFVATPALGSRTFGCGLVVLSLVACHMLRKRVQRTGLTETTPHE